MGVVFRGIPLRESSELGPLTCPTTFYSLAPLTCKHHPTQQRQAAVRDASWDYSHTRPSRLPQVWTAFGMLGRARLGGSAKVHGGVA